jgi:hypothetical protein
VKNLKYLEVIGTAIVLFIIALSCTTSKKMAMSCPVPSGQHKSRPSFNRTRGLKNYHVVSQRQAKRDHISARHTTGSFRKQNKSDEVLNEPVWNPNATGAMKSDVFSANGSTDYKADLYASLRGTLVKAEATCLHSTMPEAEVPDFENNDTVSERIVLNLYESSSFDDPGLNDHKAMTGALPDKFTNARGQDTLYLKDGTKAAGKVIGKSRKEVRFQRSDGPVFIFSRDEVEKIVIGTAVTTTSQSRTAEEKLTDNLSRAGFILTIAGYLSFLTAYLGSLELFLWAFIFFLPVCSLAGLLISVAALRRMRKIPGKYKTKGIPVISLILSIIGIITAGILGLFLMAGGWN